MFLLSNSFMLQKETKSKNMSKKTLGIVGGMGPLATAEFFYEVVNLTRASCDADHIHVIMDSDPSIPNRSDAVLGNSAACISAIRNSVRKLEQAGADVLVMPCNTAHAFFDEIADVTGLPFLNMVKLTCAKVAESPIRKVGLLATDGTLKSGIYQNELAKYGIETIFPSEEGQHEVMGLIYDGIKAGKIYYVDRFRDELEKMSAQGAGMFILGCTELPIAFEHYGIDFHYIDTAKVLARAAVEACVSPEDLLERTGNK